MKICDAVIYLQFAIRVWREMMTFDELQQVGSVEEKQDRSKDRTLRDSKVDCR